MNINSDKSLTEVSREVSRKLKAADKKGIISRAGDGYLMTPLEFLTQVAPAEPVLSRPGSIRRSSRPKSRMTRTSKAKLKQEEVVLDTDSDQDLVPWAHYYADPDTVLSPQPHDYSALKEFLINTFPDYSVKSQPEDNYRKFSLLGSRMKPYFSSLVDESDLEDDSWFIEADGNDDEVKILVKNSTLDDESESDVKSPSRKLNVSPLSSFVDVTSRSPTFRFLDDSPPISPLDLNTGSPTFPPLDLNRKMTLSPSCNLLDVNGEVTSESWATTEELKIFSMAFPDMNRPVSVRNADVDVPIREPGPIVVVKNDYYGYTTFNMLNSRRYSSVESLSDLAAGMVDDDESFDSTDLLLPQDQYWSDPSVNESDLSVNESDLSVNEYRHSMSLPSSEDSVRVLGVDGSLGSIEAMPLLVGSSPVQASDSSEDTSDENDNNDTNDDSNNSNNSNDTKDDANDANDNNDNDTNNTNDNNDNNSHGLVSSPPLPSASPSMPPAGDGGKTRRCDSGHDVGTQTTVSSSSLVGSFPSNPVGSLSTGRVLSPVPVPVVRRVPRKPVTGTLGDPQERASSFAGLKSRPRSQVISGYSDQTCVDSPWQETYSNDEAVLPFDNIVDRERLGKLKMKIFSGSRLDWDARDFVHRFEWMVNRYVGKKAADLDFNLLYTHFKLLLTDCPLPRPSMMGSWDALSSWFKCEYSVFATDYMHRMYYMAQISKQQIKNGDIFGYLNEILRLTKRTVDFTSDEKMHICDTLRHHVPKEYHHLITQQDEIAATVEHLHTGLKKANVVRTISRVTTIPQFSGTDLLSLESPTIEDGYDSDSSEAPSMRRKDSLAALYGSQAWRNLQARRLKVNGDVTIRISMK
ncbi:hypothetical protein CJU90_3040 [Yarrowia sp. C11]|nr:hypothetical protein CJU90_3040 [Yarrowia sp. C11]